MCSQHCEMIIEFGHRRVVIQAFLENKLLGVHLVMSGEIKLFIDESVET